MRGRTAAREGRYDEALDEYIWFHDHALEFDPDLLGVRLSFALSYWAELAMIYPNARSALREIRDRKAAAILTGEPDVALFQDVVRINEEAFSDRATYDLFVTVRGSFPSTADEYSSLALQAIVAVGDFPLARQCLSDPDEEVRRLAVRLNENVEALTQHPQAEMARGAHARNYVKHIKLVVAILRGTGESKEADRVQAFAAELVESPEVREAVWRGLVSVEPFRGAIPEFGRN